MPIQITFCLKKNFAAPKKQKKKNHNKKNCRFEFDDLGFDLMSMLEMK